MRLVINLKNLKKLIAPQHFKTKGMHTLKDFLKKNYCMTKVDLKDAFFMVPIHQLQRQHLHFSVQDQNYQFTCPSFGLSCASWVFTKALKPVLTLHRVRLVAYIDNILVMAEIETMARDHTLLCEDSDLTNS